MSTIPPHIEMIALQLLPQFVPKSDVETTLTFQFTLAPSNTYRVTFAKKQAKGKAEWELLSYEELVD